jgi:hypothetical protein
MFYEIIAADDQISFSGDTVSVAPSIALGALDAANTQPLARTPDRLSSTR